MAATIKSGLLIWNFKSGKHRTIQKHESINVYGIDYSPDGKTIAAGGQGRTLRLWDVATGKQLKSMKVADTIAELSYAPDGKTIAVAVFPPGIIFYEPATGKQTPIRLIKHSVRSLDFSHDGKTLAVSGGGVVTLVNLDTDELIGRMEGQLTATFGPIDGQLAALAGPNIFRLDPKLASVTETIQFSFPAAGTHDLTYTPDGRHLVTANGNGTIYVLRLQEWSPELGSESDE